MLFSLVLKNNTDRYSISSVAGVRLLDAPSLVAGTPRGSVWYVVTSFLQRHSFICTVLLTPRLGFVYWSQELFYSTPLPHSYCYFVAPKSVVHMSTYFIQVSSITRFHRSGNVHTILWAVWYHRAYHLKFGVPTCGLTKFSRIKGPHIFSWSSPDMLLKAPSPCLWRFL